MARPSFGLAEYLILAKERDLEFIAPQVPGSIKTKISWRCLHCGTEVLKSYHYLKYQEHGCRCQNGQNLPLKAYEELGQRLGISLVYLSAPRNIFQEVEWLSKNTQVLFSASYRQLGYDTIPERLKKYLELP